MTNIQIDFQELCSNNKWSLLTALQEDKLIIQICHYKTAFRTQVYEGQILSSSNIFDGVFGEECVGLDQAKQYLRDPLNFQLDLKKKVMKITRTGVIVKAKIFTVLQVLLSLKEVVETDPGQALIASVINKLQRKGSLQTEEIKYSLEIISSSLVSLLRERAKDRKQKEELTEQLNRLSKQVGEVKQKSKRRSQRNKKLQQQNSKNIASFSKELKEQIAKIESKLSSKFLQLGEKIEKITHQANNQEKGNQIKQKRESNQIERFASHQIKSLESKIKNFEDQIDKKMRDVQSIIEKIKQSCIKKPGLSLDQNPNINIKKQQNQVKQKQDKLLVSPNKIDSDLLTQANDESIYTHTYENGNKYLGGWKDGQRSGKGEMLYSNGSHYYGDWLNDKREGNGEMNMANGDKYIGNFADDKKTGKGEYTWASGSRYVGDYLNDKMHGNGAYFYSNGNKYDGQWVNGNKQGKGEFTWPSGTRYVGGYLNDIFEGFGEYYFANGDKMKGTWKNGKKQGIFMYECKGGGREQRTYKNGELLVSKKL